MSSGTGGGTGGGDGGDGGGDAAAASAAAAAVGQAAAAAGYGMGSGIGTGDASGVTGYGQSVGFGSAPAAAGYGEPGYGQAQGFGGLAGNVSVGPGTAPAGGYGGGGGIGHAPGGGIGGSVGGGGSGGPGAPGGVGGGAGGSTGGNAGGVAGGGGFGGTSIAGFHQGVSVPNVAQVYALAHLAAQQIYGPNPSMQQIQNLMPRVQMSLQAPGFPTVGTPSLAALLGNHPTAPQVAQQAPPTHQAAQAPPQASQQLAALLAHLQGPPSGQFGYPGVGQPPSAPPAPPAVAQTPPSFFGQNAPVAPTSPQAAVHSLAPAQVAQLTPMAQNNPAIGNTAIGRQLTANADWRSRF